MTQEWVNTIGLLMDAVGVIVVFKFGWRQPIPHEVLVASTSKNAEEEKKARRHKGYSVTGLVLIVGGFAVQIAATWM